MATLVLFSTLSFIVDMHFCGDSLKDFAIFERASSCEMDAKDTQNDCAGDEMATNCCSDKIIQVKGQDTFKIPFDKLSKQQENFIVVFAYFYFSIFEEPAKEQVPYRNYTPPLLAGNLQVLHQTFLI